MRVSVKRMSLPNLSSSPYLTIILLALTYCFGAVKAFDAHQAFEYVDKSCDAHINQVNAAGDDYLALVRAALTSFPVPDSDQLAKKTYGAYWGVHTLSGGIISTVQAMF